MAYYTRSALTDIQTGLAELLSEISGIAICLTLTVDYQKDIPYLTITSQDLVDQLGVRMFSAINFQANGSLMEDGDYYLTMYYAYEFLSGGSGKNSIVDVVIRQDGSFKYDLYS